MLELAKWQEQCIWLSKTGHWEVNRRGTSTYLDPWEEAKAGVVSASITDLVVYYCGRLPKENVSGTDGVQKDDLYGLL